MVGEHDKTEGQHQGEHAVSAILPHPAYTAAPPYPHDAALLTLAAPLTFSARVAPVCLPAAASLYAGRVATVTGWGSTLVLGASSAVLREANVTIMANEECGEAFSDSFDSPWIKKYFAKTLTSSFIYAILVFIFARMGAVRVFVAETLAGQCSCWRMEGTLRFGDGMSSCHVMCQEHPGRGDQLGRRHPRHQAAAALPRVQHQPLPGDVHQGLHPQALDPGKHRGDAGQQLLTSTVILYCILVDSFR